MSAVNSMTGFTRYQHQDQHGIYIWEIKTLNHRFNDLSLTVPPLIQELELKIRQKIISKIKRGKIYAQLSFFPNDTQLTNISVNENIVNSIKNALGVIQGKFENSVPVSLDSILNYPGVINSNNEHAHILDPSIISSLGIALDALTKTRAEEGLQLKDFLKVRIASTLEQINILISQEEQLANACRENLYNKISEFKIEVDKERFEQEVVLLITKMDIAEELHRFQQHVIKFQETLESGGVIGRKLDFMLQEILREVNTIGSKVSLLDISNPVIEIKVIIEQMREQVQNIE